MDRDVFPETKVETKTHELEDPQFIVNLGVVAAKIAFYNFQWRFVTLVVFNTMSRIGVESFLTNYNQSIYLKYGRWLPRHRLHVPQFVIFGQETAELSDTVQWIVQSKYDNTARYVVVCVNPKKCDENEIFETFSRLYVVNVMFLKPSENDSEPLLFSYYPILPGKCNNNRPYQIDISNCLNNNCFKKMYPEKLGNMHKCIFVVSTLEQPPFMHLREENGTLKASGADGGVINILSEILNGTLIIRTPDDGEWGDFENNNWTGSFGDIFNKRAHVSLCAAPLTPEVHGNFQISHSYASLDMVWAARLPAVKPSFEKLFYPFKMQSRIALFGIFLVIILVNTFMKSKLWDDIRNVLNIGPTNASLFFYSIFVFLGMPLVRMPTKGTLRTIIISWIWFCYVIRTAYQAALVGTLKLQLYEDYMEDFEDVLKNNYPYGGLGSLRGYYSEDTKIISNWVYVRFSKAYGVLDSLLNGTSDFVIALNKEYIIDHLMRFNGTKHIQIIPEKIVNTPAVLYFKKFNPFREPINRILSIMTESGIIDQMYSHHLDLGNYFFSHEATPKTAPLNMAQISSSLVILFIGWFISVVYFFIELFASKIEKRSERISLNGA